MNFDLEAARAKIQHYIIYNPENKDTDCGLGDLARQAILAEEALDEIEKLITRNNELEKMLYSAIGQIAWSLSIETGRMPDKMGIDFLDWQVPPEIKKTWTDWAARQLQAMPEEAGP